MTALLAPTVLFEHGDDLRQLASARRDRVRFVDLPETRFLAVDGHVAPGTTTFTDAIGALFKVAYPLHFQLRGRGVTDDRIGLLEGLYWFSPDLSTAERPKRGDEDRDWSWRLLMAVPDAAADDELTSAIARHVPAPFAGHVYPLRWAEGPSAQILHVGPYADEAPSLRRLYAAIADAGLRPHGAHHEIYLNDPGRVGAAQTKTVLRQPVTPM